MAEGNVVIKATDKTKAAFKSVNSSLKSMSGLLFNAKTAIAGLVGAGGFGAIILRSASAADSLAKTADKLGLTTEALGGLRHAAELTGVSTSTMDMALQRMTRRLAEAAQGTGEAKGAIKELGLDAASLANLTPDKAFQQLSEAMANTATQGDKVRLAMKLFDSEGVALVNTMALGAEGLRKLQEEASAYGTAISRVDAVKIEQANDAFTRVKTVIAGVGTTIAAKLAPFIEAIGKKFTDASFESNGFKDAIQSSMEFSINAVGKLVDAIQSLQQIWALVKLGAAASLDGIVSGIQWVDDAISNLLDKIPGLDVKPSDDLKIWADASKMAVNDAAASLETLLSAEAPSAALKQTLADIQNQAQVTAEKIAAAKVPNVLDAQEAMLDAEFAAASDHSDRMHRLIEMENAARASQIKLEKDALQAKFNVAKGITGNLATLMSSSSKKEFEIGKTAAIANALISGYEAVTSSYAAGARIGGPVLGGIFATTAAYATKVQIDNIKRQQFGGGGGISVSGGAGGGVATGANFRGGAPIGITGGQDEKPQGGTTTVNLVGDDTSSFSLKQVDSMFTQISEALERGDKVLFRSNSRQALELS